MEFKCTNRTPFGVQCCVSICLYPLLNSAFGLASNIRFLGLLVWLALVLTCALWQIEGVAGAPSNAGKVAPRDGDVRLVDGDTNVEGTVLVFRGYAWGRVCDDNWRAEEANVVCRQLGLPGALKAFHRNKFRTVAPVDYLIDDVFCKGNETSLIDCQFPGWAIHDCRRDEAAGVRCLPLPEIASNDMDSRGHRTWNPLRLDGLIKEQLEQLQKTKLDFSTVVNPLNDSLINANTSKINVNQAETAVSAYVVQATISGVTGLVCADYFRASEAIVFCRQTQLGIGGSVIKFSPTLSDTPLLVAIVARCYGNETNLADCLTYAETGGRLLPCASGKAAAVRCVADLPDLLPSLDRMETSAYMAQTSLWYLNCAISENCLPDAVHTIIDRNPATYAWKQRSLLRFTSVIINRGTADFLPLEHPDNWEWHACHMHYHSMKVFARYEIIDKKRQLLASGHKASFCLEDNACDQADQMKFRCSNVMSSRGTQGISPGCRDIYQHDYDCQWVDVTDMAKGEYVFQVAFNPDFLVPESDFFNNGVSCRMIHLGYNAVLRGCHFIHPYDML